MKVLHIFEFPYFRKGKLSCENLMIMKTLNVRTNLLKRLNLGGTKFYPK